VKARPFIGSKQEFVQQPDVTFIVFYQENVYGHACIPRQLDPANTEFRK
jgi:hypothetical protein